MAKPQKTDMVLAIFVLYDLIQEKKGGGRIPVLEKKN